MVALPAASGILLALSLPPRPVPLLAVVALAPLAFHLRRLAPHPAATRAAFLAGAVTGAVHAALLLHWLPGAAVPLLGAVAAVPAALAVWGANGALTGAAVALAHRAAERGPLPLPVALGGAWILLGWIPAAVPAVGLPWLGPEAALVERPGLLGAAGVIGGAGVAGLLAAVGVALGAFAAAPGRRSGTVAVVALAILTAAGLYGVLRAAPPGQVGTGAGAPGLETAPGSPDTVLRVAALSIDADPDLLADRDLRLAVLPAAVARVDGAVGPGEVDLVLWPESPTGARDGAPERELARERAEARGTPVLFGALGSREGEPAPVGGRVLNRVLLAHPDGAVTPAHEKRRLVPGVEWAPPWESGGLAVGARRPPFAVPPGTRIGGGGSGAATLAAVPAGAVICFEALFPGEARRLRRAGARILFVVSNEGWLAGRGGGPFDAARAQHRAAAVLLAAETRMPVVRSAVGGPAGAWDAYGRPLHTEVRMVEGAGAASLVSVELAADPVPPSSRGGAEGVGLAALLLLVAAGLRTPERRAGVPG